MLSALFRTLLTALFFAGAASTGIAADKLLPVVRVTAKLWGHGTLIQLDDGFGVITNSHVVMGADTAEINVLGKSQKLLGRKLWDSPLLDAAILGISRDQIADKDLADYLVMTSRSARYCSTCKDPVELHHIEEMRGTGIRILTTRGDRLATTPDLFGNGGLLTADDFLRDDLIISGGEYSSLMYLPTFVVPGMSGSPVYVDGVFSGIVTKLPLNLAPINYALPMGEALIHYYAKSNPFKSRWVFPDPKSAAADSFRYGMEITHPQLGKLTEKVRGTLLSQHAGGDIGHGGGDIGHGGGGDIGHGGGDIGHGGCVLKGKPVACPGQLLISTVENPKPLPVADPFAVQEATVDSPRGRVRALEVKTNPKNPAEKGLTRFAAPRLSYWLWMLKNAAGGSRSIPDPYTVAEVIEGSPQVSAIVAERAQVKLVAIMATNFRQLAPNEYRLTEQRLLAPHPKEVPDGTFKFEQSAERKFRFTMPEGSFELELSADLNSATLSLKGKSTAFQAAAPGFGSTVYLREPGGKFRIAMLYTDDDLSQLEKLVLQTPQGMIEVPFCARDGLPGKGGDCRIAF